MSSLAIKSSACCDPDVISTFSGEAATPYRFRFCAIISRSGPYPSVGPYCNETWEFSLSAFWQASPNRSVGKSSPAGSPPANEMISGFCVSFNSSRIAELLILAVRNAYRWDHGVHISSLLRGRERMPLKLGLLSVVTPFRDHNHEQQ